MDLKAIKTNYPNKKFLLHFNVLGDYDSFESRHDTLTEAKKELNSLIESEGQSFYATISKIEICFSLANGRNRKEVNVNSSQN